MCVLWKLKNLTKLKAFVICDIVWFIEHMRVKRYTKPHAQAHTHAKVMKDEINM